MSARDLTLEEVRGAWRRRQRPPETLRGCTVEAVACAEGGWLVRYRTVRGGPRTALLRDGGAGLRAGWYGTLVVARGEIVETREEA